MYTYIFILTVGKHKNSQIAYDGIIAADRGKKTAFAIHYTGSIQIFMSSSTWTRNNFVIQ